MAVWKDLRPTKFTAQEIDACRWVEDCGIRGWILDLLTKEVQAQVGHEVRKFANMVEFAEFHGMDMELRRS